MAWVADSAFFQIGEDANDITIYPANDEDFCKGEFIHRVTNCFKILHMMPEITQNMLYNACRNYSIILQSPDESNSTSEEVNLFLGLLCSVFSPSKEHNIETLLKNWILKNFNDINQEIPNIIYNLLFNSEKEFKELYLNQGTDTVCRHLLSIRHTRNINCWRGKLLRIAKENEFDKQVANFVLGKVVKMPNWVQSLYCTALFNTGKVYSNDVSELLRYVSTKNHQNELESLLYSILGRDLEEIVRLSYSATKDILFAAHIVDMISFMKIKVNKNAFVQKSRTLFLRKWTEELLKEKETLLDSQVYLKEIPNGTHFIKNILPIYPNAQKLKEELNHDNLSEEHIKKELNQRKISESDAFEQIDNFLCVSYAVKA